MFTRNNKKVRRRKDKTRGLSLESLEKRNLLATLTWTGAGSDYFDYPGNWSPNHVPTVEDTVVFNGNATIRGWRTSSLRAAAMSVSGAVKIDGDIDVGTLVMNGGSLVADVITSDSNMIAGGDVTARIFVGIDLVLNSTRLHTQVLQVNRVSVQSASRVCATSHYNAYESVTVADGSKLIVGETACSTPSTTAPLEVGDDGWMILRDSTVDVSSLAVVGDGPGGMVDGKLSGSGHVMGDVFNSGLVEVGNKWAGQSNPALFSHGEALVLVEGNYTQTNTGELVITDFAATDPADPALGPPNQDAVFSSEPSLRVRQHASLAGKIKFDQEGYFKAVIDYQTKRFGWSPTILNYGSQVTLLDFASFSGRFNEFTGAVIQNVYQYPLEDFPPEENTVVEEAPMDKFFALSYFEPNSKLFRTGDLGRIELVTARVPTQLSGGSADTETGSPLGKRTSDGLVMILPGTLQGNLGASTEWPSVYGRKLANLTNWDVAGVDWFAYKTNPLFNMLQGHDIGESLAFWLREINEDSGNYSKVHIWGLSSGTWPADGIADRLEALHKEAIQTHLTLVDSGVGILNAIGLAPIAFGSLDVLPIGAAGDSQNIYEELGDTSDFAEHYYDISLDFGLLPGQGTHGSLDPFNWHLPNAHNIIVPSNFPEVSSKRHPHAMANLYYQATIDKPRDPRLTKGWGFPRSAEFAGRALPSHSKYPRGCVLRLQDGLHWCGMTDFLLKRLGSLFDATPKINMNIHPPRAGELWDDRFTLNGQEKLDQVSVDIRLEVPENTNALQFEYDLEGEDEATLEVYHNDQLLVEIQVGELARSTSIDGEATTGHFTSGLLDIGKLQKTSEREFSFVIRGSSTSLVLKSLTFAEVEYTQVRPQANAGKIYEVTPGESVKLDGRLSSPSRFADNENLRFDWDVDGDGEFDDARGPSPKLTAQDLAGLGIEKGVHIVRVAVEDDEGYYAESSPISLFVFGEESWQNPGDPNDVNFDGTVSPLDALQIINRLSRNNGSGSLEGTPHLSDNDTLVDVNGDGVVSPIDALLVINQLNSQARIEGEFTAIANQTNGSPVEHSASASSSQSTEHPVGTIAVPMAITPRTSKNLMTTPLPPITDPRTVDAALTDLFGDEITNDLRHDPLDTLATAVAEFYDRI